MVNCAVNAMGSNENYVRKREFYRVRAGLTSATGPIPR
jgi:hypothetical protein